MSDEEWIWQAAEAIALEKYYVELVVTYPDWKPLPYAKWIGFALLFVLDPLRSTLGYFMERWLY